MDRRLQRLALSAVVGASTVVSGVATWSTAGAGGVDLDRSAATLVSQTCPASPGVTATQIKIGILGTDSGVEGPTTGSWNPGVEARLDVANAGGGIDGRTLVAVNGDNQTNPALSLLAAQALIQNDGAFLLADGAPESTPVFSYTLSNNVPLVGYGNDPNFATNRNTFSAVGIMGDPTRTSTNIAQYYKVHGISKVAVLSVSDAGDVATNGAAVQAFKSLGIQVVYTNFSLTQAPYDATADAGKIRDSGAQAVFMSTASNPFDSLYGALGKLGVHEQIVMGGTTYDPGLLKGGTIEGAYGQALTVGWIGPKKSLTPAARSFVQAMNEYAPGVAQNVFAMYGWLAGDFIVHALQRLGPCPTRQGFINTMRKSRYTSPLLAQRTISYSPGTAPMGTVANCAYVFSLGKGAFNFASRPSCGKIITIAPPPS